MSIQSLSLLAIPDIPLIKPGDDLARILVRSLSKSDIKIKDNDIFAIAQKIISKAEGRIVDLNTVTPSPKAIELAQKTDKDPRQIELVLSESNKIISHKPGVIIVEHHSGIILANAGIDHSNVEGSDGQEVVSLLPEDSNRSARQLKKEIETLCNKNIGIIITDSIGRPWRLGTTGVALGSAGVQVIRDLRGDKDLFGRELKVSETADADSLASAACLIMGEGNDATPLVLIRGMKTVNTNDDTRQLLRLQEEDLFR
jgi:coenzyme F420-0:L-glutamate ligase / coenzyme F420-1:gamma-L-glutamate ligase